MDTRLLAPLAALLAAGSTMASNPPDARAPSARGIDGLETAWTAPRLVLQRAGQQRGRQRGQGRGQRRGGRGGPRVTALFQQNCASCHGENAQGTDGVRSLVSRALFAQEHDRPFFDAIKSGPEGHEFGETLSDEQVWGLVVHIRERQAAALREESGSPQPVNGVYTSQLERFVIEDVVTEGLSLPWSVAWLADGQMLVTNRPGGLHVYDGAEKVGEVEGLPPVVEQGQGGLMDVRPDPGSDWIYLSLADPVQEGQGAMTKVYRGKLDFSQGGIRWTDQQVIWETDQQYYNRRGQHFGCKIDFDGRGHVFFSIGERGTNMAVQDDTTPYGKVMRLNLDGSVPDDNPVPGSAMWTTGHRNQQGLTFDLQGNLWVTEHGPRGGDELNHIVKGENYGWPVKAFSINYSDAPFRVPFNGPGESYKMPAYRWLPSCAASGLDVVNGVAFPRWRGDLLAGGLRGQNLDRIRVRDGEMVGREELLHGLGRVRDINVHVDGTVYIALNAPDKIIRLVPVR